MSKNTNSIYISLVIILVTCVIGAYIFYGLEKEEGLHKPNIYTIEHFLTDDECDRLVKLIREYNIPSRLTHYSGDKDFRTSNTHHFSESDTFTKKINDKICKHLVIDPKFGEPMQGQYYKPGNQFKNHYDWFDPNHKEVWNKFGKPQGGQRTWTFMIYLNDTEEGGETYFPKLDKTFYPKKGTALVWLNTLGDKNDPNPDMLHSGKPVKKGEKFIVTKWFRKTIYLTNNIHLSLLTLDGSSNTFIDIPD